MIEINNPKGSIKNITDLKNEISKILKVDCSYFMVVKSVDSVIKTIIDISSEEVKSVPYKEVTVKQSFIFTNNEAINLTLDLEDSFSKLDNDLQEQWLYKLVTLQDKYKNFRITKLKLYQPIIDKEDKAHIRIELELELSFNPNIFESKIYNAKSGDKIIETYNNSIGDIKIDFTEDYTLDNTQLTIFNHPFVIAREILIYAYPKISFIAIPLLEEGTYKIVHIKNYTECKIIDLMDTQKILKIEMHKNQETYLKSPLFINMSFINEAINNDFKMFLATNKISLLKLIMLSIPTYFPSKDITVTTTGKVEKSSLDENTDNKQINFNTKLPSGLFELLKEMTYSTYAFDFGVNYTVSNEYPKHDNLIELTTYIYYINAFNKFIIFPINITFENDKITIREYLIKKINDDLKYDKNKNRLGLNTKNIINITVNIPNLQNLLNKVFKL